MRGDALVRSLTAFREAAQLSENTDDLDLLPRHRLLPQPRGFEGLRLVDIGYMTAA
jgi:hypothetical protein